MRDAHVLVLGSGAREHALCWKLAASLEVGTLSCAPGNPGIARAAAIFPEVAAIDGEQVVALCRARKIDLVVVGPEAPLVAGVSDRLRAAGVRVFGPSAAAARVEGSKAFAKALMREAGIPTADYAVFDDLGAARAHAGARGACVVKADGLAAGKGVVVCRSPEEAVAAVEGLQASLGGAAAQLVIEDLLEGEEVSAIALCDGERYAMLPSAQDHKRLLDGDRGPNTGGMGACSPAPVLPPARLEEVGRTVIGPALRTLAAHGTPFVGALYAGLMVGPRGIQVLEFNARFGDPECQVMTMRLEGDLLPWLWGAAEGALPRGPLLAAGEAALGVVLASEGYPERPRLGDPIEGIEEAERTGALVFHAGTRTQDGKLMTAGGRVLTVCAPGPTLEAARDRAYAAAERIRFRGRQMRRDIGWRALGRA